MGTVLNDMKAKNAFDNTRNDLRHWHVIHILRKTQSSKSDILVIQPCSATGL